MPRSTRAHKERSPKSVTAAIITMSDTRTPETDDSGRIIRQLLKSGGHKVVQHVICRDEPSELNRELDQILSRNVDTVIVNGGTGVSPRDITIETISLRLEKKLDGFGELFRMLSYDEIGSAAMVSRAVAGTCGDVVIFCLPGSPDAVRLALKKLVLPEITHIVGLVKRSNE